MPTNGFYDDKNKVPVYTKAEIDPEISKLDTHVANGAIHVTSAEKNTWNAKVGLVDGVIPDAQIPATCLRTSAKGAANGVATLGGDSRIPVWQMPCSNGWVTTVIPASSLSLSWYTFNIAAKRAKVVVNFWTTNQIKLCGDYDKDTQTLVGIGCDRRSSGESTYFGDLKRQYHAYDTSSSSYIATVEVSANANGLRFRMISGATARDITVMVRQDA